MDAYLAVPHLMALGLNFSRRRGRKTEYVHFNHTYIYIARLLSKNLTSILHSSLSPSPSPFLFSQGASWFSSLLLFLGLLAVKRQTVQFSLKTSAGFLCIGISKYPALSPQNVNPLFHSDAYGLISLVVSCNAENYKGERRKYLFI